MRKTILRLCKERPNLANDDIALMAAIWIEEGWYEQLTLVQNLKRVSNPETIRRTRQKLQQEGLLKRNEDTTDRRYIEWKRSKTIIMSGIGFLITILVIVVIIGFIKGISRGD